MGDIDDIREVGVKQEHSCTAFVRLVGNFSNLIAAHTTFNNFALMLRVYKIYI